MTNLVTFQIKWGKETVTVENYDISKEGGTKAFKVHVSELTNVPIDRMKVMGKSKGLWKGILKDDDDETWYKGIAWNTIASKGPVQLLLMGSAAELTGPKEKTVFIEDLPPEEIAKVVEPSGLVNLGNTCYLNSVTQCLRAIPQFRSGLQIYTPTRPSTMPSSNNNNGTTSNAIPNNPTHAIFITSLRETYRQLDRHPAAYQPAALVQATKMAFPQFAQTGPHGQPMQQDAEEFYSGLLTIAATETQHDRHKYFAAGFSSNNDNSDAQEQQQEMSSVTEEELMGANNLIDAIFGLKMKETLTCDELTTIAASSADSSGILEPPVVSFDLHRKLVCNIQGGSDGASIVNVNYIAEGIKLSLEGKIEKHSDVLGRNAIWTRTQRIARLPPIICVQFGRFYWKATPDSQDHAGVKCKVMKPVAFGSTLDVYDFCTPDIQQVLKSVRDKALAAEEDRIHKKLKGELIEENDKDNTDNNKDGGEEATKMETSKDDDDEEMDEDMKAALAMSLVSNEPKQQPIGPGLPSEFQGHYELFAVVTHKGRDADGGHYMAWVKADTSSNNASGKRVEKIADSDETNEDWYVFDDDEVSPCKTEDVLKLKGGGDWHMSYLNFYRAKK